MATEMKTIKKPVRSALIPRSMRERVNGLLEENYAYMDSRTFRHKYVEEELFTEDAERELPLTSWYQPTRDDVADLGYGSPPQLMKGAGRAAHVPAIQLLQEAAERLAKRDPRRAA